MIQHGQVFKLKVKGEYGQPLWAYRYRLEGRRSARPQVGGFATRAEAQRALAKALERIGPGGRGATLTLAELVEEYLEMHQAEPVTIAKLRWLLSKATAELGDVRLAELAPKDVYAWRLTIPEGHRYEATQALRQVLNRAVAWGLIDYNPASAVFRTQCGARRRSDRSSRGSRSRRSRSGSASSMGRWSCLLLPLGFDPRSCSGSSGATSIARRASFTCDGRTPTADSTRRVRKLSLPGQIGWFAGRIRLRTCGPRSCQAWEGEPVGAGSAGFVSVLSGGGVLDRDGKVR